MKNLLLFVSVLLVSLIAGCSTTLPAPHWSFNVPEMTGEGLIVVGVGYPSTDERTARNSAVEAALTEFLRYTGMEISSYVEMVTHENSNPGAIVMSNTEKTRVATEGFVQKVQTKAWHLSKTPEGRFFAFVQIEIPVSEVARIEQEKLALHQAKREPYRRARKDFDQAIREHRIIDALHLISQVSQFSQGLEKYGIGPQAKEQLLQEATEGLEINPCQRAVFHLQDSKAATLPLCVTHNGAAVENLPLAVQVPSGQEYKSVTDNSGVARFKLRDPSYPGSYQLLGFIDHPDYPGVGHPFSLQVTGAPTGLSDGLFHDFVEAVEYAAVRAKDYPSVEQAEQVALKTARHLVYAKLLEMRDGMVVEMENAYSSRDQQNLVRSSTSGLVVPQIILEKITHTKNRVMAEVKARLSL